MPTTQIRSALVVDAEPNATDVLSELRALGFQRVDHVETLEAAQALLEGEPDLLLVEANLPDAGALRLVEQARGGRRPPVIIAMGTAAGGQLVADLIWQGADAYLEKPLLAEKILDLLDRLTDGEAVCERMARLLVGRVGLKEAQYHLRGTMNTEALSRTRGSRRAAAHLLGVDRRYVQRMVAEFGDLQPQSA